MRILPALIPFMGGMPQSARSQKASRTFQAAEAAKRSDQPKSAEPGSPRGEEGGLDDGLRILGLRRQLLLQRQLTRMPAVNYSYCTVD